MDIQNLSKYLHEVEFTLIPELKLELTKEDKREFKEWKKSIGTDNYWKWYFDNIDDIKRYTSSTPAQRNKLKKYNSSNLVRVQFIMASIHFMQKAIVFLEVYQSNLYVTNDSSYRGMTANTGEAYFMIQKKQHKLFLC